MSRNPTVQCRILNSPPLAPVLSHLNLVNAFSPHSFQIQFNSILTSTPRSSKWSFSFSCPHQNYVRISLLTHTSNMPHHLFGWVNRETSRPSFANFLFRLPSGVCRLLNCVSEAAQICPPSATTDIGPNIYSLSTVLATRYAHSYFEVLRYRF